MLGVKKQLISQIINNRRNISEVQLKKLIELFPDVNTNTDKSQTDTSWLVSLRKELKLSQSEFADALCISQSLYSKLELGRRTITKDILKRIKDYGGIKEPEVCFISYCPDTHIPACADIRQNEKLAIDCRLLVNGNIFTDASNCCVVTLRSNDLFPRFLDGDKIILDLSKKEFVDNHYYYFEVNGQRYVRLIRILPDKIKCISSCEEDTFYLTDTKGINVFGLLHPNIRL